MSYTDGRGRHRADRAPITPLTTLSRTAGAAARRSVLVAAASSGLVATALAPGAQAATHSEPAKISTVDFDALTSQAREALAAAPVIAVASDAPFAVESAAVQVTAPAGAAETVSRTEATSRTTERTAVPSVTVSTDGSIGARAVSVALQLTGIRYVSGGSSPAEGFDCSGLVSYVYAQLGIYVPHSSSAIRDMGTVIPASEMLPGDLLWSPGHIAIYAGDGMQVEAVYAGTASRYAPIWQDSYTVLRVY
ncbi:C40 family peptidase [Antribacter soli]|uniref:C40 family peptidase n=1 Tax=Antribacter soli TaxID=2910976 RepID=UPI0027E19057|nr:NlpC/P60 family protein [Antribacter soli]